MGYIARRSEGEMPLFSEMKRRRSSELLLFMTRGKEDCELRRGLKLEKKKAYDFGRTQLSREVLGKRVAMSVSAMYSGMLHFGEVINAAGGTYPRAILDLVSLNMLADTLDNQPPWYYSYGDSVSEGRKYDTVALARSVIEGLPNSISAINNLLALDQSDVRRDAFLHSVKMASYGGGLLIEGDYNCWDCLVGHQPIEGEAMAITCDTRLNMGRMVWGRRGGEDHIRIFGDWYLARKEGVDPRKAHIDGTIGGDVPEEEEAETIMG